MNPRHHHTPVAPSTRACCPVCRQPVYSPAGIHPQCAIRQSEAPRPKPAPPGLPPTPVALQGQAGEPATGASPSR
jgi:hypothetical protein